MKRVVIAVAASFLSVGAIAGASYAATEAAGAEWTRVDQTAVDALAKKIADAIKALGESPTEDAVYQAILSATSSETNFAIVKAAIDKVGMDSALPDTAKAAVATAAKDAQEVLKGETSTGSVATGNVFGNSVYFQATGGDGSSGGGSAYTVNRD